MRIAHLIYTSISICFLVENGYSQTPTTIYTPNGSVVPYTYLYPELTPSQILGLNAQAHAQYPNATIISDASATYNCHGYAWYVSEGGTKVWINAPGQTTFWADKSYYEVPTQSNNSKVSYPSGDHSAITTDVLDVFISKWGNWPLMRHNKDDSPYNSSGLKYYKHSDCNSFLTISGNAAVCTTKVFPINAPTGSTVIWTATPSGTVSLQPNGNIVTLTAIGTGQITLTASVGNTCGNLTPVQLNNILVGDVSGYFTVNPSTTQYAIGSYKYLTAQQRTNVSLTFNATSGNVNNLKWSWDNWYTTANPATINLTAPLTGYTTAYKYVYLDGVTGCGATRITTTIAITSMGWAYAMIATPNPASSNINVGITKVNDTTTTVTVSNVRASTLQNSVTSYTTKMSLYDFNTNALIKQWIYNETTSLNYNLNITGVLKGYYVLKMERENKVTTTKILVQ